MLQNADTPCRVINARTGATRDNTSWVLGRIMQDFEFWKDLQTSDKLHALIDYKLRAMRQRNPDARVPKFAGLVVSVYKPSETQPPGSLCETAFNGVGPLSSPCSCSLLPSHVDFSVTGASS
jgi:hypothetical protein